MDLGAVINALPLWAVFLLTFAILLCSVEAGAVYAARVLFTRKEPDGPLNSLVTAVLGLLAFILAFTFGMTASRFESRRQLVLDESNAIGTTYLRAELMPAPEGPEIRRLLREYTDVRLKLNRQNLDELMKRSGEIHMLLWKQAKSLSQREMDPQLRSLFIDSLNGMIDLHQSRLTVGLQYRIPWTVWFAVYLLAVLAMISVGYQVGMTGSRRIRGTPVLAAAFSVIITMTADIDRPGEGMMQVSQQAIADVRQMMEDSP